MTVFLEMNLAQKSILIDINRIIWPVALSLKRDKFILPSAFFTHWSSGWKILPQKINIIGFFLLLMLKLKLYPQTAFPDLKMEGFFLVIHSRPPTFRPFYLFFYVQHLSLADILFIFNISILSFSRMSEGMS